jgi:hypothetical protein
MVTSQETAPEPLSATSRALKWTGLRKPLRAVYRRVAFPTLTTHPTGALTDDACAVLVAATEAVVGVEIDTARYAEFFRWRAETLPGHRALYEQFATTVNRLAPKSHGRDFVHCTKDARLAILQPAFRTRTVQSRLDRLRKAILHRNWFLFDLHIIRQIALLFGRTDAWRFAGYDSWPGMPRGLERYQEPARTGTLPEAVPGEQ